MAGGPTGEVTQLLESWQDGNEDAFEALVPLVYDELRMLARSYLRKERAGHTLQPTALVHEAYARLVGGGPTPVRDRSHFFAVAAQAMRRILVDHARRHRADKRISPKNQVPMEDAPVLATAPDLDMLALHEALEQLTQVNERQGRLVELRYFGGLENQEAADVLGVSRATVDRDWKVARLWLMRRLSA